MDGVVGVVVVDKAIMPFIYQHSDSCDLQGGANTARCPQRQHRSCPRTALPLYDCQPRHLMMRCGQQQGGALGGGDQWGHCYPAQHNASMMQRQLGWACHPVAVHDQHHTNCTMLRPLRHSRCSSSMCSAQAMSAADASKERLEASHPILTTQLVASGQLPPAPQCNAVHRQEGGHRRLGASASVLPLLQYPAHVECCGGMPS